MPSPAVGRVSPLLAAWIVIGCGGPAGTGDGGPIATTETSPPASTSQGSSSAPRTFVIPPPPSRPPFVLSPVTDYGSMATVTAERLLMLDFVGVIDWPNYPIESQLRNELGRGASVLLSKGPVASDGIDWYEIYFTPIAPEPFRDLGYAWIPGGSAGAQPTNISIGSLRCPDAAAPGVLASMTIHARLGCLGSADIELRGTLDECTPVPHGLGMTLWDYTTCFDMLDATGVGAPLWIFFPPDVDTARLRAGQSVRVVGHLDDPAAATCRTNRLGAPPVADDHQVMICRGAVVVTEVVVIDGQDGGSRGFRSSRAGVRS